MTHVHRHRHERGPFRATWHTHAHRHGAGLPIAPGERLTPGTLARRLASRNAHRHAHRARSEAPRGA